MNTVPCRTIFCLLAVLLGYAASPARAQTMSTYILDVMDVQVRSIIIDEQPFVAITYLDESLFFLRNNSSARPDYSVFRGGLLSVAPNAIRRNRADDVVRPLINNLGGFNFRDTFRQHLREQINNLLEKSSISLLEINTLEDTGVGTRDGVQTLEILTSQFLSQDATLLVTISDVGLFYPGTEKPISARHLIYISEPVMKSKNRKAAISKWAERDARLFKQVSTEAIESTIDMLAFEVLSDQDDSVGGQVHELKIDAPGTSLHNRRFSGTVVRSFGDRVIYQTLGGAVLSLPSDLLGE